MADQVKYITIKCDEKDKELLDSCIDVAIEGLEGEQYDRMRRLQMELLVTEPFA